MDLDSRTGTAAADPAEAKRLIAEYLDAHGGRHAMVGYQYAAQAAQYLVMNPEALARRQLRLALEYVESVDSIGRGRKAIDRCIRTMIAQMDDDVTVKELVFSIADSVCLKMGIGQA